MMKRQLFSKAVVLITMLLPVNCIAGTNPTMKDILGKYFLIGTAINADQAWEKNPVATKAICDNFNAIVAENCMKGEVIHPEENQYDWRDADRTVKFAEDHHMVVTGHCLVWHSQAPKWMFTYANGDSVSREVLIDRMYHHITDVVSRYKGKIKGWDVVNEAILDDGSLRKTPYYKIIGPDYIELAFKFAHAADPDAELYYNDYSMANPAKRDAVVKLIKDLKAKGCRIDAVGMQSHNGYNYPDMKEYEKTIQALINAGVKVQFTELDINMLPNPQSFSGAEVNQHFNYQQKYNPYVKGLTKDAQKIFNDNYLALFRLYRKYADHIERVTLWGVSDADSWLNNWPVPGRTNYPLLLDRNYKVKPIVKDIIKLFEK